MPELSLEKFWGHIEEKAIEEEKLLAYQEQMTIIDMVAYGSEKKISDVDFSSFSLSNVKHAFEDVTCYVPEEGLDMDEDEDPNRDSLLTEINRIFDLYYNINKLVRKSKQKRRFV